jgi:hypothetical protein
VIVGIESATGGDLNTVADSYGSLVRGELAASLHVTVVADLDATTVTGLEDAVAMYGRPVADPNAPTPQALIKRHSVTDEDVTSGMYLATVHLCAGCKIPRH